VPRQPDSGVYLSEIVLVGFNSTINAYWNEFAQNRWIFAISRNTGGFAYFPHKYGGFLELTPMHRDRPMGELRQIYLVTGSSDNQGADSD
jgi:hypothetical protein